MPLEPVAVVKLLDILDNDSYHLQHTLTELKSPFSEGLLDPKYVKERYNRPFLPAAVRL